MFIYKAINILPVKAGCGSSTLGIALAHIFGQLGQDTALIAHSQIQYDDILSVVGGMRDREPVCDMGTFTITHQAAPNSHELQNFSRRIYLWSQEDVLTGRYRKNDNELLIGVCDNHYRSLFFAVNQPNKIDFWGCLFYEGSSLTHQDVSSVLGGKVFQVHRTTHIARAIDAGLFVDSLRPNKNREDYEAIANHIMEMEQTTIDQTRKEIFHD